MFLFVVLTLSLSQTDIIVTYIIWLTKKLICFKKGHVKKISKLYQVRNTGIRIRVGAILCVTKNYPMHGNYDVKNGLWWKNPVARIQRRMVPIYEKSLNRRPQAGNGSAELQVFCLKNSRREKWNNMISVSNIVFSLAWVAWGGQLYTRPWY